MTENALPAVPPFRLTRVLELRNKLRDEVGFPFLGDVMAGSQYQALIDAFASAFPRAVTKSVLFDSCRNLLGRELSATALRQTAWRLAGNLPTLRRGIPVHPWTTQVRDEWVPVLLTGGHYTRTRWGKPAYYFQFLPLAGSPAGMAFSQVLTSRFCAAFAPRMGFSRSRRGPRPFIDGKQFGGLYCCVLVEMRLAKQAPKFFHVAVPDGMKKTNIAVLNKRMRKGWVCPRSYTHRCCHCVIGYSECEAATHAETYGRGYCRQCGHADALFDPLLGRDICINCTLRGT